ncbi:MAG: OmpA family protein [Caulobacteraceae bacterium]
MNLPDRRIAQAALIALAALALAACASHPKPMGPAPTAQTPRYPPPVYGRPTPAPPPGPVGESEESGTPAPGSERDFVINAGERVYFDFNRYDLRDDARPILDAQAAWLARYPAVHVRIEGNCDELGTREYNFALGARRANTVREYLMGRGVGAGRIETVSFGKEHPIDTSGGEEAQAHNRNAHTALTEGAR